MLEAGDEGNRRAFAVSVETPRAAIQTAEGHREVIDLFKSYEQNEARQVGGPSISASFGKA